jgi:hypothetical protein
MTTKRQIKDLVQPLLERNPDLVLVGRQRLWLREIGSVGRMILVDRTGNPDCCVVDWFMPMFFMPEVSSWENLGRCHDRLFRSKNSGGGQGWYWSDPTMPADFITRVEADVIALLRPLDTVRKRLAFTRTRPQFQVYLGSHWHLIATIVAGELDAARAMWAKSRAFYRPGRVMDEPHHQLEYDRLCLIDEPLMADDRAGLAALLHRWEAENIVGSPLEPYWIKETLPLEEG